MSFAGDLRGIGLADVFQNVAANRITGTLCVRVRRDERHVRFEGGAVSGFSLGAGRGLCVVEHLCETGALCAEEVERTLARNRRSKKAPIGVLLEKGVIDPDRLRAAVADRVREAVYELFLAKDAEFRFEEGSAPARVFDADLLELDLRLDVGPLLMEAARRRDELERIQLVVGSPDDLFVLLEGYEAFLEDTAIAAIAPHLDGRTTVAEILRRTGRSSFVVRKAIYDLVQNGVARPCSVEELLALAGTAESDGRGEDAMRALERATRLTPGDRDLRRRLAGLLEQNGRRDAAAVELARLGHDATRDGDHQLAIECYRHAVTLAPEDLPLQEKLVGLLEHHADIDSFVAAMLEFVARLRGMGLAERARQLLQAHVAERGPRAEPSLVTTLADVESDLGHWQESARLYRALGERLLPRDETAGLTCLRAALRQDPRDAELSTIVADIESGRAARRRARRRRLVVTAACSLILVGAGVVGGAELTAARRASVALGASLGELDDGRAIEALAALQDVKDRFGWTPSGRHATAWLDHLIYLHLQSIRTAIESGEYDGAILLCGRLAEATERGDVRASCGALRLRAERERAALDVVQRADREGLTPAAADLEALRALGAPEHLDFLVQHTPRVKDAQVRIVLLGALSTIDSSRIVAPAVRTALRHQDGQTLVAVDAVLAHLPAWRAAGQSATWDDVRAEVEDAFDDPPRNAVARRMLAALWPAESGTGGASR